MTDATTASRDLSLLALKFRQAVEAAIAECATKGYPVKVAEATRSQDRQAYLYAQGRTRPGQKVTNAPTNLTSWHGYGLAVDVIHETKGWAPGKNNAETTAWFTAVAAIFKAHGCAWGGDWKSPDMPHMQWSNMPASPAVTHREMKTRYDNEAVWNYVGAGDTKGVVSPQLPTVHAETVTVLRKGMRGEPIRRLQEALNKALGLALKCDGDFGERTAAAVHDFQAKNSLTADSIVGDKTRKALGL